MSTFVHPELGELKGLNTDGTVQFRGLKYGSLRNRFASAELFTDFGAGPTDATRYGIAAQCHRARVRLHPEVPAHSDLDGLNLNITVPSEVLNGAKDLPLYVFIHGGGFAVGPSWYPHYNTTPLVKFSSEIGKPIIGVSINYRLGPMGFMTSKELKNAGYIRGFGGNPDEITVVGESAGGLAVTMLLTSEEPLMKRCLSTGGAVLLFKPVPPAVAESAYQTIIKALGLADKTPEERIQALLNMPADDLWQKIPPGTPLIPSNDGETVPGVPTFAIVSSKSDDPRLPLPGRKWCSALMIGESQLDANILAYMGIDALKPGVASKFIASVTNSLGPHTSSSQSLFDAYYITPETSDEDAILSILRFASEVSFYAPARAFAQGWPCTPENKFFLYHFKEGIPWAGRFQGEAGHILDVAFLFQNYNDELAEEQKQVATAYARYFIEYVNGGEPWPSVVDSSFNARVYGPSKDGVTATYSADGKPEAVGRDKRVLELGEEVGFDKLLDAFQKFFQGK
ncbi:carboxylesteras-like protein [Sporormia fimetaria CBS 119925]|uniref:Carboxylic ester hydrolase n=1 Tax=Sporormia fimetaria CBS 119925 TaxID=1340428 RepID=A0A6A6VP91_9PLEO|nr:carboxylesteras-like protein [Sporormia fimetaria CBS 119925]